jgi:crossover junction endodeoxyribonuclease RusA
MPEPLVITLPIPDRRISPNASRGQSKKAALGKSRITRRHKTKARVLTLELLGEQYHKHGLSVPTFAGYSIAHFFKTAAFRDDDNADGACKAYRDGIADALGINDRHFPKVALSTFAKDAINPRVEITLHLSSTDH